MEKKTLHYPDIKDSPRDCRNANESNGSFSTRGEFCMAGEIWKDIKGYERLYQVSNMGRVKSLERARKFGTTTIRIFKEQIKKQRTGKSCLYPVVDLSKKTNSKTCLVHRLVALTFLKNLKKLPCVNHKDGNRFNNKVENLEWISYKQNTAHAISNGLIKMRGDDCSTRKLSSFQVIEIRKMKGKLYHREIAEKFGVCRGAITAILGNKVWKHI